MVTPGGGIFGGGAARGGVGCEDAHRAGRPNGREEDLTDAKKIRACYEVYLAAQRVDEPWGPWFTDQPFDGWRVL